MKEPIEAKNLTAQLQYCGDGNPPSTHPNAAAANCFPGLEMDFRNVWKRILAGIELHESTNFVMGVDGDADSSLQILADGYRLLSVEGIPTSVPVTGPKYPGGPNVALVDSTFHQNTLALEWSNALAAVLHAYSGKQATCKFQSLKDGSTVDFRLMVRPFFAEAEVGGERVKQAVISAELAPPGELTQSLCSPWQSDYRQCACFYWAATRPDYVNIEPRHDGTSTGNNWLQKDRTAETPKVYVVDDPMDTRLVSSADLFRRWETVLKFIIGGEDEEPPE